MLRNTLAASAAFSSSDSDLYQNVGQAHDPAVSLGRAARRLGLSEHMLKKNVESDAVPTPFKFHPEGRRYVRQSWMSASAPQLSKLGEKS